MDINKKNRSDLKSYFVKNSVPTESNFADLIDATLNQKDDGIVKLPGDPLTIEAAGDVAGLLKVVNFYAKFQDNNPAWSLQLNPRTDPNTAATAKAGFAVVDGGSGATRLFIDKASGNLGIGTLTPQAGLAVVGTANVSDGNGWANANGKMAKGSLTVGSITTSYGGGTNWTANTAGLLMETLANTEIAVHDSNTRLSSLMYYEGDSINKITIGRSMDPAWGVTPVVIAGNLTVNGAITPSAGKSETNGIMFPKDPGGGGGDAAWLRYYARAGESMTLELGTSNDPDDHIALMPSGGVGIGTNAPGAKVDIVANTTTWGGWYEAIRLSQSAHSAITHPGGGLLFGMHSDRRFYFADTKEGQNIMILDGNPAGGGQVSIGASNAPIAKLDIAQAARSGAQPAAVKGLYITGDFGPDADGVEFRHSNATQGIGFGYNTIYAAGSNADQDLQLKAKGAGAVRLLGNVALGGFTGADADEWPKFTWYRDTANNWDEGLIKHASNKGFFGRAGFGIHLHSSRDWTFFSTGWNSLFGIEGGTGNTKIKGNLTVNGALTPSAGNSATSGLVFPKDPAGGGGDAAWLRYYARAGESMTLELGTSNEPDDHIALMPSGGVGIGTNTPGAKLDVEGGAFLGYETLLADFGVPLKSGFYQGVDNIIGDIPDTSHPWVHLIAARHSNTANNHQLQIASAYASNDKLFFRKIATGNQADNPAWNEMATRGPNVFSGNQLFVNGAITPSAGNTENSGILFPKDPAGGGGDAAWLRYYARAGESMTLELGINNDGDDHIALMSSGNVGIGLVDPKAKLDVAGEFIRKVKMATGLGPNDETDNGQVVSRVLTFTKYHPETAIRIFYCDNLRVNGNNVGVRWEIRVDGRSTPGGGIYQDKYGSSGNYHEPTTILGYASGISGGSHTIGIWVSPAPGYGVGDAYTGWNNSRWTLEVQEVWL